MENENQIMTSKSNQSNKNDLKVWILFFLYILITFWKNNFQKDFIILLIVFIYKNILNNYYYINLFYNIYIDVEIFEEYPKF